MGNEKLDIGRLINKTKRRIVTAIKNTVIDDLPPSVHLGDDDIPTLAAMKAFNERYPLASTLPYESYDEETGLYYNRDTVGFMLHASPATGLSPSDLSVLNGLFSQTHVPDTTIQVSLISDTNIEPYLKYWADSKTNVDDPKLANIFRTLANNRVNYLQNSKWNSLFKDQAFLTRRYHLVISVVVPVPEGDVSDELDKNTVDLLVRNKESFIGTLRSAKIFAESMKPETFINLMNGILNPSETQQPYLHYDENNLISKQIVDSDTALLLGSSVSTLKHKEKNFSLIPYHVRQFPLKWAGYNNGGLLGSFTNNVLRIPCPFIFTLVVEIPDQIAARGMASRKSIRATQMATSPVAKFATQWIDRKKDWDYTKAKIDSGNKLLQSFYQIMLIAPEGREQECEQALKALYDNNGWILTKSRYTPMHVLFASLPMGLCTQLKKGLKTFKHFSTNLSWTCTNIAPWIGEWNGTKTPMQLLAGRRGQLTYFDPFDNEKGNYNIACTATSGSGKSFYTQEWIFSCLGSGGRGFIIDSGGSYKNLAKMLYGTYIEFGEGFDIRLNPFTNISDEDPKYFKTQWPLLKLLISQMASPDRPLSQKQKSVLEKAIQNAWREKKNKATITTVVECLYKDTSDSSPMYDTAKDLAVMLYSYTKDGMFAEYFEGDSNIDLDNRFVVLELDGLSSTPDLQSVVLLILMMRITQVMYLSGNRKQRKLCIIDEAWQLLGGGGAGKFIERGYRVARKFGGSFMTIVQKVSDYYSSDTATAAFMNSDFTIYLRQKPEELAQAETKGHIDNSDGKVTVLKGLETVQGKYSELAISSPDGLSVLRFIVDPVSEKLYSTKAEEVDYIRDVLDSGGDLITALEDLAARGAKR